MTISIADRIVELTDSRVPFVRATVVRAQEPSSAHAGDRAIILADGSIEGFVGGHCAASSVRSAALGTLGSGESLLLRVLPEDEGFPETPGASVVVNPCLSGGALEIYLEPLLPPAAAAHRRDLADRRVGRRSRGRPRVRRATAPTRAPTRRARRPS